MTDYIKVSFGKWMTQVLSIIFFIIGARYLDLNEYGIFGILSVFIAISDYLSRETLESLIVSNKISLNSAIRIACEILFLTIVIISISYFIFEINKYYIIFLLTIFIFHWISAPFKAKLIELNLYVKYSYVYTLSSIISIFFGIISFELGYGVFSILLQQVILNILLFISSYYFIFISKVSFGSFDRAEYKPFLKILPSSIIFVLSARLDVLIVSSYLGLTAAGLYTFCRRIFQIIQDFFIGGLDKLLLKSHIKISFKKFLIIHVTIFLILYLMSIASLELIPLILGQKWSNASEYLLLMVPGATYLTSIALLRSKYVVEERYTSLMKVRTIELVLSILLLIPIFFYSFLWVAAIYFSIRFFFISNIMTHHIFGYKFSFIITAFLIFLITYLTYSYTFQKI